MAAASRRPAWADGPKVGLDGPASLGAGRAPWCAGQACRRATAQAFLVQLEKQRKAERATRRVLRSLQRMARAFEPAASEPPASEPAASEPAASEPAPSELAASEPQADSEDEAVGDGGEAGKAEDISVCFKDLSQESESGV